jgi:hypothetical protein
MLRLSTIGLVLLISIALTGIAYAGYYDEAGYYMASAAEIVDLNAEKAGEAEAKQAAAAELTQKTALKKISKLVLKRVIDPKDKIAVEYKKDYYSDFFLRSGSSPFVN